MALPGGIQTCVMTGTLLDDAGNPLAGQIWLNPSIPEVVSASTNVVIYLRPKNIQLDVTGSFAVPLICSSEGAITPNGVTWTLSTTGPNAISATFTVPNDQTTADVSNYIVGIQSSPVNQILVGYRGPQGVPGTASDSALAALVNADGSATRTALDAYYVPASQLYIGGTAPANPAVGTIWINNS